MTEANADQAELAKFSALAHQWWDLHGEFAALHQINPLRLDWIDGACPLNGQRVLDVGCGGGILADAMARRGADVLGIDLAEKSLKVAQLHAAGADYLADCIVRVGPQNGDPVTNAVPGLSWHQWGEAADCFWVVKGDAEWSTKRLVNGLNGYRVMAEEAKRLGLDPGGLWRKFPDWPHVQLRPEPSPLGRMTLKEVSAEMQRRFKR